MKYHLEKLVSVCKLLPVYCKALVALVKAVYNCMKTHGYYTEDFVKIGKKWYCIVPGFPKWLFGHTLMVGSSAKLIEYCSQVDIEVNARVKVAEAYKDKYYCGMSLIKNSSTLTGGAFYRSNVNESQEEI